MSNFPRLVPAFTTHIILDGPLAIGPIAHGTPLTVAPFLATNSFLRSEPAYALHVDAVFAHGSDYIRQDPSGRHLRLEVNSTLRDVSGALIVYKYTGIITLNAAIGAVLSGAEDAKTTEFGNVVTHILFETGSEALRGMEERIYVGSGRFVVEKGKPVVVEYKISEVVA